DCFPVSAIVIAGGVSKRLGEDKGLVKLGDKPLVLHVLDKLEGVVDEVVVIVNSETQMKKFAKTIDNKACIMPDKVNAQTPLAGALTGFEAVQSKYTLLLACDTPFLLPETLSFLLEVCLGKSAAIPRWPNGNIEPLHASYHAQTAAKAAKTAIENGESDMRSLVENMRNIRYISTMVLQQFDPKLITFFNINTPSDLKQAEALIRHHVY
ncbi:MAG: molybdenum cofactor guanylyltransferase, partial [Candidatus Bathyarchaeia archaeon]